MKKQIIALGGGGFTQEPKNPLLDLYILAQSHKKDPRICFLPTASGDNNDYTKFFEATFKCFPCQPRHLDIIQPSKDLEEELLSADIIYVGGGNTKSMLGLWYEWDVDKILKKAYNKGILLAGVSAGSVCWFESCVTDSIPGKMSVLPCLGLLKGSNCPHYSSQSGRPEAFKHFIQSGELPSGYAADDGVGLHFIDGTLTRIVSSRKYARAYHLYLENKDSKKCIQDKIVPEYLEDNDVVNKYIINSETFSD